MLEQSREKLNETVAAQLQAEAPDLEKVREAGEIWYADLKEWETLETWPRAFGDNRMTARCVDPKGKIKEIPVGAEKVKIKLDAGLGGIEGRLDAENFINKLKNEKGLHDLSGAVLRGDVAISRQLFKVAGGVIFMPLPLEEDLKALYLISTLAKQNRASELYKSYVRWRANITRIKYGSDNDMAVGFLILPKPKPGGQEPDGKVHVRYGMATIGGGPLSRQVLDLRTQNALNYKAAIALSNRTEENNEVVISYRHHNGSFPWLGLPIQGKAGNFNLLSFTTRQKVGILRDNGSLESVQEHKG